MQVVILDKSGKLKFDHRSIPQPKNGQVLVKMLTAALNRRDYWITRGLYTGIQPNVILGSDGCGVVVEVGENVDRAWKGKIVIFNPGFDWGDDEEVSSMNYRILGMPYDGTFAEYMAINVDRVHEKPKHLTVEEGAALPLAGLTAYRALFVKGGFRPKKKVLVTGIGSGVAQFVAQFAASAGGDVWVTSSSEDKINRTMKLGITGGVNYKEKDWDKTLLKRSNSLFDIIVDGVGGEGLTQLLKVCKFGGKIVSYGATDGMSKITPYLFLRQLQILGTSMGSDNDFENLLKFVNGHQIKPVIHSVHNFDQIISAVEQMESGNHIGKIVIKFNTKAKL